MSLEQKTALVTGGAGFIGSFLCEALLRNGYRVICIDNFSTGYVRNIEGLLRNPDFQFLRLDINEPFDLESFAELEPFKVKFLGVHEIYHLAMPTISKGFEQFRIPSLLTNAIGTRNILDVAVKYSSKFLLTSSAVIYGNRTAEKKTFSESDVGLVDHLTPRAPYNEGKRFAETMVHTYGDVHHLDVKIARIFRTFGPRMSLFQGHQIPDFVLAALENKPLAISGDETTTTALLYVSDVVDALIRLMHADASIGPVNVGSDVEISMKKIAADIITLAESTSEIVYEPAPPFLTQMGLPDLAKARGQLGWIPLVGLDDGLAKTIDYVRANKLLLTDGV
ncbi:MAG: GDP-mannose 4,6-dehydratase [Patescibacteria group bacterium]|mgnify:CR=1 FL=1